MYFFDTSLRYTLLLALASLKMLPTTLWHSDLAMENQINEHLRFIDLF